MAIDRTSWRYRARVVIERVLDQLPAGTSEAEAKKAISDAYPFGERAMHPYKVWLSEVRDQLAARFPKPPQGPLFAEFVLREDDGTVSLGVDCPWCKNKGCLLCGRMHEQINPVLASPEYMALAASVADDPFARVALCDWLEERGIEVERFPGETESKKES